MRNAIKYRAFSICVISWEAEFQIVGKVIKEFELLRVAFLQGFLRKNLFSCICVEFWMIVSFPDNNVGEKKFATGELSVIK